MDLWEDEEFKAEWHNRISSMEDALKNETDEIDDSVSIYKMRLVFFHFFSLSFSVNCSVMVAVQALTTTTSTKKPSNIDNNNIGKNKRSSGSNIVSGEQCFFLVELTSFKFKL